MKLPFRNRIFVVDDSPIVRERLVELLLELPNVEIVGQAGLPFDAIEGIERLKPGIVVLDISMPEGGGMLVLERVKKFAAPPLVIMLTNFSYEPYRQRCFQLGADYFFDKSKEFDKVLRVVRQTPRG